MGGRIGRIAAGDSPPRRSAWLAFSIIAIFDFTILLFLWIVLVQQDKSHEVNIVPTPNVSASLSFDVRTSTLDLVFLSLVRCLVGCVCYGLLRWMTRLPMVIVTLISTAYAIGKAVVYDYSQVTAKDPFHLVLLFFIFLSSIIMPWFTVFFFEFKYLTAEVSQYQSINWRSWKAWIWPRGLKRKCVEHLNPINSEDDAESRALLSDDNNSSETNKNPSPLQIPRQDSRHVKQYGATGTPYLTPTGSVTDLSASPLTVTSLGTNTEIEATGGLQEVEAEVHLSQQDLEYKAVGASMLTTVEQLLSPNAVWKFEKEQAGITCYSMTRNGNKIWRADRLYPFPVELLWKVMYEDAEEQSNWNTEIACNKVIHTVDECTDIVYTVTAPAVGGLVSPRDFVSLRVKVVRPGQYMSLGTAVVHEPKPPQPGIIRGENGTSAYVLTNEAEDATKFIWIVQTDLKGWLPRYVIDQAVGGMMIQTHVKLWNYIHELYSNHSQ